MPCPNCQAPLPSARGRVVCPSCGASFHLYRGALVSRTSDLPLPEQKALLIIALWWWARWQAVIQRSA